MAASRPHPEVIPGLVDPYSRHAHWHEEIAADPGAVVLDLGQQDDRVIEDWRQRRPVLAAVDPPAIAIADGSSGVHATATRAA